MLYLQIVKTWAEHTPEAIALLSPEYPALSYTQMYSHLQALTAQLAAHGVTPDDRIAVALPNGPAMALTLLATMSVATCAPLNPAYTEREFAFSLSDLKAKVLIVPAGIDSPAVSAARQHGIPVLTISDSCVLAGVGIASPGGGVLSPARETATSTVALLLHTSGTTSRPKLVPLTHANLLASAQNIVHTLNLIPADRCLTVMPLFHIHGVVAALMAPLVSGGSIVCPRGFYAPEFFAWLQAFHPTWYTAVPTMHQAILARAQAHADIIRACPLRFIRSSSAALPLQVLKDLEHTFQVPVIEAYGMTEAAHQMASNPLPPALRKPGSVGRAAGPEIAIMNDTGTLLPPGTTGEVVIRGANVTPGYEDNPTANASAFTDGWFRTGDQGYVDRDGYVFLTGRLKEIINRGGEKVAPREVDEVLLTHPSVAQAVTFAVPHPTLGEDVAAAVVLRQGQQETAARIRQFLFGRVADFKIPSQIVIANDIPKGPTGKIQRVGLAAQLAQQVKSKFVAPRNTAEEQIASIYATVLALEQIGIHDNFFALGGDSLRATRVMVRLRTTFPVNLPLVTIFKKPTVAELAEELIASMRSVDQTSGVEISSELTTLSDEAEAHTIPRRTIHEHIPLSFTQERLWFLDQLEPNSAFYNTTSAMRLQGVFNLTAFRSALTELVTRHDTLRTAFPSVDGTPFQVIAEQPDIHVSVFDLRAWTNSDREEETIRLLTEESQQPFNLAQGPLLRTLVVKLGPEEHLISITMHHIISDGWSRSVLFRELATLYDAFVAGHPAALSPLPIQYADFAVWQRQQLQSEQFAPHLTYWKEQLGSF